MKKLLVGMLLFLSISSFAQPQFGGVSKINPRDSIIFSQAGVIAINTDLVLIDCSQITQINVHVTSVGTTGNITVQWSNYPDFSVVSNGRIIEANTTAVTNTINVAGLFMLNVPARYVRFRLTTATTAGTTAFRVSTSQQTNVVTVQNGIATTAAASPALMGDVGIQYRGTITGTAARIHLVSAANTNATIVKSSPGKLIGWCVTNTTAAYKFVKFHNQTTTPTAGTGVVQTIAIPPNSNINVVLEGGIGFTTGIGMTVTNLSPDADATVVAVGDVIVDIFFL